MPLAANLQNRVLARGSRHRGASSSKFHQQAVTTLLPGVAQGLSLLAAVLYIIGYLVVAIHATRLGIHDQSPFSARFVMTGFQMAWPLAIASGLALITWRITRRNRWPLINVLVLVVYFLLLVMIQFILASLLVFQVGDIKAADYLLYAVGAGLPPGAWLVLSRRRAVIVNSNTALVVTVLMTFAFTQLAYRSVPAQLGGGRERLALIVLKAGCDGGPDQEALTTEVEIVVETASSVLIRPMNEDQCRQIERSCISEIRVRPEAHGLRSWRVITERVRYFLSSGGGS